MKKKEINTWESKEDLLNSVMAYNKLGGITLILLLIDVIYEFSNTVFYLVAYIYAGLGTLGLISYYKYNKKKVKK